MQRSTSSFRASSDENNYIVDLLRKSRAKLLVSTKSMRCCHDHHHLPLYHTHHGSFSSGSRSSHRKWVVHFIPMVVLLCLFALWWFSYPVDVEIKDGRITSVRQVDIPRSLNETRIDLTSLAVAIAPYASIYHIQAVETETAAEPEGEID